jgi:hypothetical protein
MSRRNTFDDDNEYGLMYENDPILGKTLTTFGALVPWIVCVSVLTPILAIGGMGVFLALTITPWIGLLASIVWIEMNY